MSDGPARRGVALAALIAAVGACALVLLRGGGDYTIHAVFPNADGLVTGGEVQVAGRKVGSISDIRLSDDGRARVTLSIGDDATTPLHAGTRASIRTVGQAGLANRFVELAPGPQSHAVLRSGATLPASQTSGVVNIDALLDSFGPAERARFAQLVANAAGIYAGSGARSFNVMLRRIAPATREIAGTARELSLDRAALGELITSADDAVGAVDARRDDLYAAVQDTSTAFGALAAERRSLSATLTRAPTTLRTAADTLAHTRTAVTSLRPALRRLAAVAPPARGLLTEAAPLLRDARPVITRLREELPQLGRSLDGLKPLRRPLVAALRSTGTAMRALLPTLTTARLYGPDLVLGVFSGLVGVTTGAYDARGHYAKVNFIQGPDTATSGPLADLLQQHPLLPDLLHMRTKLTRRCPGGLVPPAPDGSSPWDLGSTYCTAAQDVPASVNEP